jgi:DNA-binding CsgD family transcriptional regulator
LLLDGLAAVVTDGRAAGAPKVRRALDAFLSEDASRGEWFQWGLQVQIAAIIIWDAERWVRLSARHVALAREAGAMAPLHVALSGRGLVTTWCGDFEAATLVLAEETAAREVTGSRLPSVGSLMFLAYKGRPAEAQRRIEIVTATGARREGLNVQIASWATAILHNGLGRYADALAAAEQAADASEEDGPFNGWVLPELIEAATRCHQNDRATAALRSLSSATDVDGSDWAAGIASRSRALVATGAAADALYAQAVEQLARTPVRPELARAHLLYGEWLRRENRRVDARLQLRAAHEIFVAMGADAFAERARGELLATGEKVRKRHVDTRTDLTPQEDHIARLAREGRTNPEIAAELFLSARTVEWHLRKVFTKLGITSRRELRDALSPREVASPS